MSVGEREMAVVPNQYTPSKVQRGENMLETVQTAKNTSNRPHAAAKGVKHQKFVKYVEENPLC